MKPTDPIEDQLRELFGSQASAVTDSRIDAIASRDYAPQTRRKLPLLAAGTVVAAAVAAALVLLLASPKHSGSTDDATAGKDATGPVTSTGQAQSSNTIELVGYRLTFPANYKVGKSDTACTADLHLSAEETKRLVTTPAPGCPILVTSVVKSLPGGATKIQVPVSPGSGSDGTTSPGGTPTLTFYVLNKGKAPTPVPAPLPHGQNSSSSYADDYYSTIYVPAALPDGSTVYVTLAGPPGNALAWPSDVRQELSEVPGYSPTQLFQFEHGLDVTQ